MPSGQGAGTNPIHNKKKKTVKAELDEDDIAYKNKLAAEKKQREELAKSVGKGKGPLNTGSQGIKKSGKK
ncbi:translation machinery associated TMA7 [Stemphylium lycopersici]|nr:translation machinery associated TMA7 [Stemphylium lycopersici]